MINSNKNDNGVAYIHPETGYYFPTRESALQYFLIDHCGDCYKMTRISMSCYAAAKHHSQKETSVARIPPKEKPKVKKNANKYGESETSVSLDKYNGKMMFSIWGLYNRNSPHNFKKQNAEGPSASKGQETMTAESKFKSPLVQITVPQFTGIVSVETTWSVNKPKTTNLEKLESLFNFPIF